MHSEGQLFIGLAALLCLKTVLLEIIGRRHRQLWFRAGRLAEINLYPLKSAGGLNLKEADVAYSGLVITTDDGASLWDRSWIIVNADNKMITARQKPKLLKISATINGENLSLKAPNMEELMLPLIFKPTDLSEMIEIKVWGDTVGGYDCGEVASSWITNLLNVDKIKDDDDEKQNANNSTALKYKILRYVKDLTRERKLQNDDDHWREDARDVDEVMYQDGYPFLLITSSSVDDVRQKCLTNQSSKDYKNDQDKVLNGAIRKENFRTNFYIDTICAPFDEDNWVEIRIGECAFYNMKPCDRCLMTTINPDLGLKRTDLEPLKTMRDYRLVHSDFKNSPCFGINLIATKLGRVKVGDLVFIKRSSEYPRKNPKLLELVKI